MSSLDELPPEIEVEQFSADGIRYTFPRRQFTGLRALAVTAIIFGLGMFAFMVFWECGFAGGLQQMFGPVGLLSGVFAIPGFLVALSVIGVGLALLCGHTEIEVVDGMIRSIERAGRFRWTRSRPAGDIRRLVVSSGKSETEPSPVRAGGKGPDTFVLKAELAGGKNFWVSLGYPREWLLALARQLAVDCPMARDEVGAPAAAIEVVDAPASDPGEVDRREQPNGSKIIYEPLPSGLTLNVPASGIWRGSGGLFVFGLFWCGFIAVFTGALVHATLGAKNVRNNAGVFGPVAFIAGIAAFWAIGAGLLLAGVNMGRRRAGLAVADGKLMILQTNLFGSKTKEWRLEDLASVRIGPSGTTIGDSDIPILELQVVPREGKPFGLLAGREVAEIEWMATLLRDLVRAAAAGAANPGIPDAGAARVSPVHSGGDGASTN
jgi:hypothetical protein